MTSAPDKKILEKMEETRRIVSLGLEARAKASIKVRQPLKTLSVTDSLLVESDKEYRALIEDEVNVKEVILFYQVKKIEGMVGKVSLDTIITSELKKEGQLRDLIRAVQDLRKKADLNPSDKVELVLAADDAGKKLVSQFESELKDAASLSAVSFADGEGSPIEIDGMRLSATLKK